jgi:hypothetical protein
MLLQWLGKMRGSGSPDGSLQAADVAKHRPTQVLSLKGPRLLNAWGIEAPESECGMAGSDDNRPTGLAWFGPALARF